MLIGQQSSVTVKPALGSVYQKKNDHTALRQLKQTKQLREEYEWLLMTAHTEAEFRRLDMLEDRLSR